VAYWLGPCNGQIARLTGSALLHSLINYDRNGGGQQGALTWNLQLQWRSILNSGPLRNPGSLQWEIRRAHIHFSAKRDTGWGTQIPHEGYGSGMVVARFTHTTADMRILPYAFSLAGTMKPRKRLLSPSSVEARFVVRVKLDAGTYCGSWGKQGLENWASSARFNSIIRLSRLRSLVMLSTGSRSPSGPPADPDQFDLLPGTEILRDLSSQSSESRPM
jgi:hypothetical protein